jgi:hypothetical protein
MTSKLQATKGRHFSIAIQRAKTESQSGQLPPQAA